MVIDFINKVLYILLFLSVLNILRRLFFLIKAFKTEDAVFVMEKTDILILGLSIS
jgi:hypothetical protein